MPVLLRELIDLIIRYLRYDILSLFGCIWTCRAWYHSTRRYLHPPGRYAVSDRASLDFISRALIVKKTRRFHADLRGLDVFGDITRTFAIRIRGEFLPGIRGLDLCDADWEKHPPHMLLFQKLSRFVSITFLKLDHCRLHSSGQLRSLIKALPNLEEVYLPRTEVARPERDPTQQGFARSHLRLKSANLRDLTCRKARMAALTMCRTCTQDVKLHVEMCNFRSWPDFLEFAQAIPAFVMVDLYVGGRSWWPPVTEPIPILPCLRLTKLRTDGSDRALHAVLNLIDVPSSSLGFIDISVQKQPSHGVQLQLEELMRHSGGSLTEFQWDNKGGYYMPSLAFNPNLEFLDVNFIVQGESLGMHRSYATIASILSQLPTSLPRCVQASVNLALDMLSFDEPSPLESKISLATFERIPHYPVHIRVHINDNICDAEQEAFANAARHVLVPILAPYCRCHGSNITITLDVGTSYYELWTPYCEHPADALFPEAKTLKDAEDRDRYSKDEDIQQVVQAAETRHCEQEAAR